MNKKPNIAGVGDIDDYTLGHVPQGMKWMYDKLNYTDTELSDANVVVILVQRDKLAELLDTIPADIDNKEITSLAKIVSEYPLFGTLCRLSYPSDDAPDFNIGVEILASPKKLPIDENLGDADVIAEVLGYLVERVLMYAIEQARDTEKTGRVDKQD